MPSLIWRSAILAGLPLSLCLVGGCLTLSTYSPMEFSVESPSFGVAQLVHKASKKEAVQLLAQVLNEEKRYAAEISENNMRWQWFHANPNFFYYQSLDFAKVGMVRIESRPAGSEREYKLVIFTDGSKWTEYDHKHPLLRLPLWTLVETNPVVFKDLTESQKDRLVAALVVLCPNLTDELLSESQSCYYFPNTNGFASLNIRLSESCTTVRDVQVKVDNKLVGTLQPGDSVSVQVPLGTYHKIRAKGRSMTDNKTIVWNNPGLTGKPQTFVGGRDFVFILNP